MKPYLNPLQTWILFISMGYLVVALVKGMK